MTYTWPYCHLKLTADQVRAARAAYATGGVSVRALAAEHGVGYTAMWKALRGESWRWVT
jgi:predicted DNA binding protein